MKPFRDVRLSAIRFVIGVLVVVIIASGTASSYVVGVRDGKRLASEGAVIQGVVYGAADVTLDGGKTREYRLVVVDELGLPSTVQVNKQTYGRCTQNLGVTWPTCRYPGD